MVPTCLFAEPASLVKARDPVLRAKRIRVLILKGNFRLAELAIDHTLQYHPGSEGILFLRERLNCFASGEEFEGFSDLYSILIEKDRHRCLAIAHKLAISGDAENALFCAELLDNIDEGSEIQSSQAA